MLALIAGEGGLPAALVARLRACGQVPLICEMAGFAPDLPEGLPRLAFRIETLGSFLETLAAFGVRQVCMAGAVRRPRVDPAAVDAATRPLIPRLIAAMARGDDGTLREIVALFEERGFEVVGADAIAPDLLPAPGVATRRSPGAEEAAAADLGRTTIARMGREDRGQACVVRGEAVLAEEGPEGTDAMLASIVPGAPARPPAPEDGQWWPFDAVGDMLGTAADWLSNVTPEGPAAGGLLVKAPKPGQERRVDLPLIGPQTAEGAVAAGLSGIVIEAGGVLVLDLARVVEILDAAGLFLWVRPAEGAA